MKLLKKRKGLTLSEAIISLMILSVIIVGILTFISSGYTNLLRLRQRNAENVDIQTYFEGEMAEVKKNGITDANGDGKDDRDGSDIVDQAFTYRIGDGAAQTIQVKGKYIAYPKDKADRTVRLFVASQKEAIVSIPEDFVASIKDPKKFYYLGERIPSAEFKRQSSSIEGVKFETSETWLLSYRAFGEAGLVSVASMVSNTNQEEAALVRLPSLSNTTTDVSALNESSLGFQVTDKMRGRYLTYGGRVISTLGRVGSYHIGQRIWLMGIPVVNGLRDHMDADLITTSGDGPIIDPVTVQFPNHRTGETYSQTTTVKSVTDIPGSKDSSVLQSRQVASLGTHNPLQFWGNDLSKGNTLSILLTNDTQSGDLLHYRIGSNINWVVNIDDNRYLTVGLVNSSGADSIDKTTQVAQLEEDKDNSIQVRTTVTNGVLKLELILNGKRVDTKELRLTSNHDVSNATILIGGNTHINEFANFYRDLTDEEIQKMADYFAGKYSTDYNAKQP